MAAVERCKCRKFAIDPCCPTHGIGSKRFTANLVTGVLLAAVVVVGMFVSPADGTQGRPSFVSPFAWAVALCETSGDFRHDGGNYEGFVGWFTGTWLLDRRPGYPDHADEATPRQQNRVFHDSLEAGRYFGCIANGGYRSHL